MFYKCIPQKTFKSSQLYFSTYNFFFKLIVYRLIFFIIFMHVFDPKSRSIDTFTLETGQDYSTKTNTDKYIWRKDIYIAIRC